MAANNGGTPATHFGRQMKKERLARGWSLREFSERSGINFSHASRIENGYRPPTEAIARACDKVFPERKGYFTELYLEMQTWLPPGFRDWPEIENKAATLRAWSPGVIHGLLQTSDYARAFLVTVPGVTDQQVSARLNSRMERQKRVLMRDDPPSVWFVVDEMSLYRCVGSPAVMAEQLRHLADVARLPHVTMQILPATEHPANASELIVADDAAYVEHLAGGLVYTEGEMVSVLQRLMHTILSESYRASESLGRIERLTQTWTTGVKAAGQAHKEDPASKSPRTAP